VGGGETAAPGSHTSFVVTATTAAVAAAVLVVLVVIGEVDPGAGAMLAVLFLAVGAALLGWRRALHALSVLESVHDERLEEVESDLESKLYEQQQALERERKAYRAEHDWNRELRRKIVDLEHAQGALGDLDDVRALILHVALDLLDAEKGLLLARKDLDGDGDLDLAASEGFTNDPEHSRIAQRFAREVIASDETVREDEVSSDGTPADREIDNLVAIPIYVRDRFNGVLVACNKAGGFHDYDDQVLLALGDHAGAVLHNTHLHGVLRGSYLTTVAMLADAVQAKDPFLRGHSDEVAKLLAAVADRLGMSKECREQLIFGSLLHDVGKIGISERILLKPGSLTPEERDVVEMHPRIGFRLVQQVPALRPIALGVLHHHERWDGAGYPSGLSREEIPLEARLIAVADAFDAMTSERPYRSRLTVEEACEELERCAGAQFDPEIVRLFVREVRRAPSITAELEHQETVRDLELTGREDEPVLGFGSFILVDNLTLLYSHRHLHDVARVEAARAAERRKPFALLLVKLLELDRTNRELGYAAGDAVIQRVARVVEQMGHRCGGTAARLGGVCIALLVPAVSEELVPRLSAELERDLAGERVRVVTSVWREGESGEDVIDRALGRLTAAVRA